MDEQKELELEGINSFSVPDIRARGLLGQKAFKPTDAKNLW